MGQHAQTRQEGARLLSGDLLSAETEKRPGFPPLLFASPGDFSGL